MKKKMVLVLTFTLLFSAIFNINLEPVIAASSRAWKSNMEDKADGFPIDEMLTLEFEEEIEVNQNRIKLYDSATLEGQRIIVKHDKNRLEIKVVDGLSPSSRYNLIIAKDAIYSTRGDALLKEEQNIVFTTAGGTNGNGQANDDNNGKDKGNEDKSKAGWWRATVNDKDKDVPVDKRITLLFDGPVRLGSGRIILYNDDTFDQVGIDLVPDKVDGDKVHINLERDLKYSTPYRLILDGDSILDLQGNPIFQERVSISFTTEKEPDKDKGEDEEDKKEQTPGQQFGQIAGQLSGYKDFLNGKRNDWARALPSDRNIINDYKLNREGADYRESFLIDFREGFMKGYEEAFRKENFGIILGSYTDGAGYGQFFGNLLGEVDGRRDFYNDRTNDWTRWLPSDRDIIDEYSLHSDSDAYSDSFLYAFKNAYKESYIRSFRATNVDDKRLVKENGINHGQTVGRLAGETQGRLDYMAGKDNDWRANLPTDDFLIKENNLLREHVEYMEGFLTGYKEGYREAYVTTFQAENLEASIGNLKTTYLSMEGGQATSYDNAMSLVLEPGSLYVDTAITIGKLNETSHLVTNDYIIPVTASYNVKVQNTSNNIMNLRRPLILEFEYYGTETAGIYELRDGKWYYLHSTIDGNKISTSINSKQYAGGTYMVIIDERYEAMDDIAGHWAVKHIETYLKRNYIIGYPDRTFRPYQSITRAEFVTILDRLYNWPALMPNIYVGSHFVDSNVFEGFADSIHRATALGYIRGYDDGTFRPHVSISYQEVEWLMERIAGQANFKWEKIADRILEEYYVRSRSYNSMQNYISRGEVVYLLYLIEEGLL